MNGVTLSLHNHEIGNSPCISAVRATVKELINERREQFSRTPESIVPILDENTIRNIDIAPPLTLPPLPPPLLPRLPAATSLWPVDHPTYNSLHELVVDPQQNRILARSIEQLQRIETNLREQCTRQAALDPDDQDGYASKNDVEWMGEENNELGRGAEANIFAGLYKNRAHNNEKQLVAVKQNYHGRNLFNSQERDHFIKMGVLPGVVKYHCGFQLKAMSFRHDILVQDVGCLSLSQLITRNANSVKTDSDEGAGAGAGAGAGMLLQPCDLFRLTKAVAMAVQVLHSQSPSIVHRDIRPENVLIMPNGTLCLTDFGLARRKQKSFAGSSVHTKMRLTTMQPYEIQSRFVNAPLGEGQEQELRVSHAGDVFMLGCVLAFINTGQSPFDDDHKITNRNQPDLGDSLPVKEPWLTHLLRQMMSHDPDQRPSIEMVLRHPYFKTHTQNFGDILISSIERCIVNDFNGVDAARGPVDDTQFQRMEQLLRPIEERLGRDKVAEKTWHQALPASVFNGLSKLPFSRNPIAFQVAVEDDAMSRAYPLPEVAKLVKWLRNIYTHMHGDAALQYVLRRSRPNTETHDSNSGADEDIECSNNPLYYATAGEFFLQHPAVNWLLPQVWERHVQVMREASERQRVLALRHQQEKKELDEAGEAIGSLLP